MEMSSCCLEPADVSDTASALHCRDRWLALQRLRANAGAEAVLLVLGPDSHFDRGGEVVFNWLLNGVGGRDLLAAPLESRYEECAVCIRATGSKVFCTRKLQEEMVTKTAMWESCEVIVPTAEQEADQDEYDSFKTWAFIDMVAGLKSFGVAIRSSEGMSRDLKMVVEKWPLVQAHAFDEFGLGFLTMRTSVINLEAMLQCELYPRWDLLSMIRARSSVPKLAKAWGEAMLLRDRQPRKTGEDHLASAVAAAAPLVDFFEYGRLSLSDEDVFELRGCAVPPNVSSSLLLDPAPRVLVGPGQSPEIAIGVAFDSLGEVPGSDVDGSQALHMVWEAVEPLTGIAAARTYALGGASLLEAGGSVPAKQHQALLHAYVAAAACCRYLIAGHLASLAFLAPPQRDAQLARVAADFLTSIGGAPGRLQVSCTELDAMGLAVPTSTASRCVALLYLRVMVADVACPGLGHTLGTVAYGDTAFCVHACEEGSLGRLCSTGLTADFPAFAFWPVPSELSRSDEVRAGLDSCLGVGFDRGPSVALGHRSGIRVYLENKGPPPDPLELGISIDQEVQSAVAWDISTLIPGQEPLAGYTFGHAWVFESGKLVVSTPRTGLIVLRIRRDGAGLPSASAPNGLVWVPVEVPTAALGSTPLRAAVAVSPSTAGRLRALVAEAAPGAGSGEGGESPAQLSGLGGLGGDLTWVSALKGPEGGFASTSWWGQLLDAAAFAGAHGGRMPPEACEAALQERRYIEAPSMAPCRCIWVSGLPGCGALDVAVALASSLGAHLVDLAAVLGLGVGATDGVGDMRFVASVLAGVVQPIAAQGGSTLVVCDVLCSPAEVLADLAVHGPFAAVCQVAHVVSVLEPLVAYPSKGIRHPLLLSRSLRGWVSAVVVSEARPSTASRSGPAARERDALGGLLAKEVGAARSSREAVLSRNTNALVSGPLQLPPAGLGLKLLALPEGLGSREFVTPTERLRCVFVPTAVPMDIAVLRQSCSACLDVANTSAAIAGALRGLFCVEARVRGTVGSDIEDYMPEDMLGELRGERVQAVHQLVLSAAGEVAPPQRWPEPLAAHCGVLFWWSVGGEGGGAASSEATAARRAAAEAAVEESRLKVPARRPTWALENIPPEEVEKAREYMLSVEAPEGYYFSGTSYVDVDGNEYRDHPQLGIRLQEVLDRHNSGVQAWNAAVQEVSSLPMFQASSVRG